MCVRAWVCMRVYEGACVRADVCLFACIRLSILCVHVCICVCVRSDACVRAYVYMAVSSFHACMCIHNVLVNARVSALLFVRAMLVYSTWNHAHHTCCTFTTWMRKRGSRVMQHILCIWCRQQDRNYRITTPHVKVIALISPRTCLVSRNCVMTQAHYTIITRHLHGSSVQHNTICTVRIVCDQLACIDTDMSTHTATISMPFDVDPALFAVIHWSPIICFQSSRLAGSRPSPLIVVMQIKNSECDFKFLLIVIKYCQLW